MKKTYLFLLLLLCCFFSFSQSGFSSGDYRVTLGDIETNTFKKDSTANALVIYEQGNSYIDKEKYNLRTEKKHKIKILKKEGFDNATVTIYLYKNKGNAEKVVDIFGTTYNKIDGEVVKAELNKKDVFTEKYDENHTIVKFTLPNVKEGSVITFSYKIISPYLFKYHGWEFQGNIPKLYSEYKTSIPGNWLYHIKLVGGKKLAINESEIVKNCLEMYSGASADCGNSIYAMKDIPAFIEEDYMTTEDNYLARIEYELETFRGMDGTIKHYTKTWKDVEKELRTDKEIGRQIKKTVKSKDILSTNIINEKDALKKAKNIFQFVQNNYTWNGEYRIFKDVSINNLLKNKSGNISSINILLHNLLRELGLSVKPILLSTRANGFPTTIFPVLYDFNYLIVQATINDKTYLLDATDKYLSFGEIPFRCLNGKGRLLDFKDGGYWVDIKPNNYSNVFYQTELKFDKNDIIQGSIDSKKTGYHALNYKKAYYKNPDSYVEELENNYPNIDISDFEIVDDDITKPEFKESYNFEYNFDDTGDNIYLNPFIVKFFTENPFKLQQRTYPIDFGYKDLYFYSFKFNLSDNYDIVEIPKAVFTKLPNNGGQMSFSSIKNGKSIIISLRIDFKKAIYDPEFYPYLKGFMSKVVDIQTNSLIVLKKK